MADHDPTSGACGLCGLLCLLGPVAHAHKYPCVCSTLQIQTVEVLQLVLQQLGPGGCDIQMLCSLLQVSTACRAAVYESGVSCSVRPADLGCSSYLCPADLQHRSGFAAFLPGNAGLVSSLELYTPSSKTDRAPAEHLLTLAVQLCVQQQATASATGAAVQSWTPSGLQRPLRGLQLRSYTGDLLLQPAALAALGACSQLTGLEWQLKKDPAAAAVHSLRHLSTLQSLFITNRGLSFSDSCLAALANACWQLQHLTHLALNAELPASALQHLPRSLVSLQVDVHIPEQQQAAVSFSHLSCLRDLALVSYQGLSEQVALPASLTQLMFISQGGISCIPDLPNLRVLHECVDFTQPSLLRHVSGLPMLQKLVLDLALLKTGVSRAVADTVAAHVASATQLTSLQVYCNRLQPCLDGGRRCDSDESLSLLGSLRQLPRLHELTGSGLRLQADDVGVEQQRAAVGSHQFAGRLQGHDRHGSCGTCVQADRVAAPTPCVVRAEQPCFAASLCCWLQWTA